MSEAKHSPLPWRVTKIGDTVLDRDGKHIATCFCEDEEEQLVIDCANAALIVEAVNERDEREEYIAYLKHDVVPKLERERESLREVLKFAIDTIDVSPEVLDETEDWESEVCSWVKELQKRARAALGREADDGQE